MLKHIFVCVSKRPFGCQKKTNSNNKQFKKSISPIKISKKNFKKKGFKKVFSIVNTVSNIKEGGLNGYSAGN
jgi:hypothetical protein